VIQQKTADAATRDPRFTPVTAFELYQITLEISVMTPRQKIGDWRQIKLGTDGVVIVAGNRSGTFLPQVATDTGWSTEEFLGELCSQKAGLSKNCYEDPKTEIYIYQARVFKWVKSMRKKLLILGITAVYLGIRELTYNKAPDNKQKRSEAGAPHHELAKFDHQSRQ
jgi:uncharacterized protein (TIGR00296 family)